MLSNGVSGSSGSSLGNLAFAYLKHETVVDTLKPLSLSLDDIEPFHIHTDELSFLVRRCRTFWSNLKLTVI